MPLPTIFIFFFLKFQSNWIFSKISRIGSERRGRRVAVLWFPRKFIRNPSSILYSISRSPLVLYLIGWKRPEVLRSRQGYTGALVSLSFEFPPHIYLFYELGEILLDPLQRKIGVTTLHNPMGQGAQFGLSRCCKFSGHEFEWRLISLRGPEIDDAAHAIDVRAYDQDFAAGSHQCLSFGR